MIAYLEGRVMAIAENRLVLDVNHVGYQIYITARDAGNLNRTGREVKVHTYLQVREDALVLFGFLEQDDLELFKLLINVNGIGPKAALGILSTFTSAELRFAVLAGDAKTISRAPGIGAKTAQKLILELKDKLNLEDSLNDSFGQEQGTSTAGNADAKSDAVAALVALGYSGTDALRAVRAAVDAGGEDADTETILKLALKAMV